MIIPISSYPWSLNPPVIFNFYSTEKNYTSTRCSFKYLSNSLRSFSLGKSWKASIWPRKVPNIYCLLTLVVSTSYSSGNECGGTRPSKRWCIPWLLKKAFRHTWDPYSVSWIQSFFLLSCVGVLLLRISLRRSSAHSSSTRSFSLSRLKAPLA